MTLHDDYPSSELGKETNALREKVIASIKSGNLGDLVSQRVINLEELNELGESELLLSVAEALKPSVSSDVVRWIEQHNLADVPKEQEPVVFAAADEFGLRLPIGQELPVIDNPLLIVEGGANRTSVVRRGLAEEMLKDDGGTIYQLGSITRLIAPMRTDKEGNEIPNKEYEVVSASDVCGDLEGATVTEFEVNVASAVNNGYEIEDDSSETHIVLKKGNIKLIAIKAGSLIDGVSKLAESGVVGGRNVVISTNGQYRTKDVIQTEKVLAKMHVATESISAIGDETGTRGAKIYIAELANVLRELAAE